MCADMQIQENHTLCKTPETGAPDAAAAKHKGSINNCCQSQCHLGNKSTVLNSVISVPAQPAAHKLCDSIVEQVLHAVLVEA